VLFDLDGTLVDSVPDLVRAAHATLAALGQAAPGLDAVRSWVGDGVERLVHRCLTGDMAADADPDRHREALALFLGHYARENGRHARLYPGAAETLGALAAHGVALGCVTNKPRTFTLALLEALGVAARFATVVGGDDTTHKKPQPEPILHALQALAVTPADALMVGDSENDVRAARAAGVAVVAVSYGYNHGRPVAAAGPDAIIDCLDELPALLRVRDDGGAGAGAS
jgi:phosphoglycolate phosphatase